jgi:cation-transporting ATPase 13A2
MIDDKITTLLIVLRLADAVTWILPPAMPIFFSICQTVALIRIRKENILAVNPEKMAVAGKVTHMCFDKTGTLTTLGISVHGYIEVNSGFPANVNTGKQSF